MVLEEWVPAGEDGDAEGALDELDAMLPSDNMPLTASPAIPEEDGEEAAAIDVGEEGTPVGVAAAAVAAAPPAAAAAPPAEGVGGEAAADAVAAAGQKAEAGGEEGLPAVPDYEELMPAPPAGPPVKEGAGEAAAAAQNGDAAAVVVDGGDVGAPVPA